MTASNQPTSRSNILGNIRKSFENNDKAYQERQTLVAARLRARAPNTVPARSCGDRQEQVALFIAEAERVDATTARLDGLDALPQAIASYLSDTGLAARLKVAPHALLNTIPWAKQSRLEVTYGPTRGADEAGLSVAFSGVAETGTLVLHSGPDSPTTLNFLPDHHLVVLPASRLLGTYEQAWSMLRNTGNGAMPRTVNWITGPSRTADIEQTLLMGAHGPRSLHILIFDDKKTL